jgi:hypothetical protein
MPELSTLVGMNRLGCATALPAPPGVGYVPTSTTDGIVWQVAGEGVPPDVTVIEVAMAGGALVVTVNGVSATLPGVLQTDAFGAPLGYLLPT